MVTCYGCEHLFQPIHLNLLQKSHSIIWWLNVCWCDHKWWDLLIGLSKSRNILLLSSCCTQLISQFTVGSVSLSESHTVSFVLKWLTLVLLNDKKCLWKNTDGKVNTVNRKFPTFYTVLLHCLHFVFTAYCLKQDSPLAGKNKNRIAGGVTCPRITCLEGSPVSGGGYSSAG